MANSIDNKNGMTLVEVLVAMVLLAILGLGSALIASKTMKIQREAALNNMVIGHIRNIIQQPTVTNCTSTTSIQPSTDGSLLQQVNCSMVTRTATVTALKADGTTIFTVNSIAVDMPTIVTTTTNSIVKSPIAVEP